MSTPPPQGSQPDWDRIAEAPEFHRLLVKKAFFLVPATAFFVVYYFALPVLAGFAPKLMETKVLGDLNVAYLFALSQFFMAWILAAAYVIVARGWDRDAAAVVEKFHPES